MSATHFVPGDQTALAFSRSLAPVLHIDPGDIVTFETTDSAYERLWRGEDPEEIEEEAYNAVTGPVFVRGAERGDALRIDVLGIDILRVWALWAPDFGPLGPRAGSISPLLKTGLGATQVRPLPVVDRRIKISERLAVSLEPMIGCIGLAPTRGKSSTYAPAYPWGGNMDLRELSPGAVLWLPVQVPGALLSLGDIHAAMGEAEPAWVSLEAAGRATVRIGLEKAFPLKGPRLRVGCETIEVVVAGKDHDHEDAQEKALLQAFDFLTREWGLDAFEAYAYCCARVGVRFGGPASPIVLGVIPDPWERGG